MNLTSLRKSGNIREKVDFFDPSRMSLTSFDLSRITMTKIEL